MLPRTKTGKGKSHYGPQVTGSTVLSGSSNNVIKQFTVFLLMTRQYNCYTYGLSNYMWYVVSVSPVFLVHCIDYLVCLSSGHVLTKRTGKNFVTSDVINMKKGSGQ